jgi:hypothetical protein
MSYFKLGEECILQSAHHPELNGDYIVLRVLEDTPRITHFKGQASVITSGYAYIISIENPREWIWDESALRKKHKPSTKSLSTMIEELNKVKV